jgi:hypothetical protein
VSVRAILVPVRVLLVPVRVLLATVRAILVLICVSVPQLLRVLTVAEKSP